jgi:hypothetical protein
MVYGPGPGILWTAGAFAAMQYAVFIFLVSHKSQQEGESRHLDLALKKCSEMAMYVLNITSLKGFRLNPIFATDLEHKNNKARCT